MTRFAAWAAGQPVRKRASPPEAVSVGVTVKVAKFNAEERFVIGWASVSSIDGVPVVDLQGDVLDEAELEAAAAAFMQDHASGLVLHKGEPAIAYSTSIVLTPAIKKALGITTTNDRCGWIVGGHVMDDATWQRVKSGELRSLSIGGTGVRDPIT